MAETNIMDRCVLLQVSVSSFGVKRKLPTSKIDAGDADKTFLHVSKDLLKSDRYKAIKKLDSEFRSDLTSKCLPSIILPGVYPLPFELLEDVYNAIEAYKARRAELVDLFIDDYPDRRDAAALALGDLFDDSQYPDPAAVRACFSVTHHALTFSTPETLKRISQERFAEESEKLQATMVSAQETIQAALRAGFNELVSHLVDRLAPDATGKQKIFRDSLVGNVKDFFQTFNARNITDDAELAGLVDQARAILEGVDPQTLREHRGVRDTIRTALEEVKENLDQMLVDKPGRKISFEDMQGEAQA